MREKENLLGRESEDGGSSASSRAAEDSRMGSLDSRRDFELCRWPRTQCYVWMYISTRTWISACDRSNSMVVPCNDKRSLPITNLNADKIPRYDCTILELSFRSTHTTVSNVFYPVASHAYHVTMFIYTRLFYLTTQRCSREGEGLLDPQFLM